MTMGSPLQIISIETGDESGTNGFILNEKNLDIIIGKIPPNTKVALLSMVGAFRTGKSFMLNLFLRYLRHGSSSDLSESWLRADGESISEGNSNDWVRVPSNEKEQESAEGIELPSSDSASFKWRGGVERQTTGVWMWSEPFIRKMPNQDKDIAVLLMDTQGMFDNETTMTLTAQIFGLSTLVSSYQIYNVDKRIQEDNLQHLALFSEYGRMALDDKVEQMQEPESVSASAEKLDFLVRDWQNFIEDTELTGNDEEEVEAKYKNIQQEMESYLDKVLGTREASDLQSTREQIRMAVTKLNYKGEIDKIDTSFRALVNRYVRRVFDESIEPKTVNN
eukprot:gene10603-22138_t